MIDKICDLERCTGCSACMNACPSHSIQMVEGKIGHIYPQILESCIECGRCIKLCPVNKEVEFRTPQKTFAAWAKDKHEHATSTSGGMAAVLTNSYLENGGIVYGCASLPKGKVMHIRIADKNDAHKLKGSKYVHSHIGNAFVQVKNDLKEGKNVLFIGLPCQVAGLRNFIGKNSEGLCTVDLVCHGVPSQRVLFDYLEELGIRRESIDKLGFREQSGFCLSVESNGKNIYHKPHIKDLYYLAFLDNLCFRDSCFSCRYASDKRCSDLTIGDFWGLGKKKSFPYEPEGNVSLVLVNSSVGEDVLSAVADHVELVERELSEAVEGNHNLRKPSACANANKFKVYYDNKVPMKKAFRKCLRIRRIKALILLLILKINEYKRLLKTR